MIKLIGKTGSIEIRVLGYLYTEGSCSDDNNWLQCKVSISLDRFSLTANCALQTYDLRELHDGLRNAHGLFKWAFPEDDFALEFEIEDQVVMVVHFLLRETIGNENITVSGEISLCKPCKDVREDVLLLQMEFPVLGDNI